MNGDLRNKLTAIETFVKESIKLIPTSEDYLGVLILRDCLIQIKKELNKILSHNEDSLKDTVIGIHNKVEGIQLDIDRLTERVSQLEDLMV